MAKLSNPAPTAPSSSSRSLAVALATGSVLIGIAIPVISELSRFGSLNLAILAIALVFLCVLAMSFALSANWRSLRALSSLAFLGYPVGAILLVLNWIPQFQTIPVFSSLQHNRTYLLLALLLGFAAYLFLLLGYRLHNKSLRATSPSEVTNDVIRYRRLMWVVAAYAVLGAVAIAYHYAGQGGLSFFLTNIARLRTQATGSFYLSAIAGLLPVSCILWFGLAPKHARRNIVFWGLVGLASLYSISSGAIWTIVSFVLILALLSPPRSAGTLRKSNIGIFLILTIVLVAVAVMILSWRALSIEGRAITLGSLTNRALEMSSVKYLLYLTIGGRNATDVDLLAWIIRSYIPGDLLWGRTLLDIPLMAIPRAFWPEKPTEIGVRLFQEYSGWEGYPNAWHAGIVGELYVNFSVIGVIVGMLLLGALCARLDWWGLLQSSPSLKRVFYAVIGVKFVVMGLVTGFMFPVIQTLLFVVPIYLAGRVVIARPPAETKELTPPRTHANSDVYIRS